MKQAPLKFVERYYTDDLAERNTPETKFYLSWLKRIRGKTVLSLGCGPNLYDDVRFFGRKPREIVGIDLNRNNIYFLKRSRHPELLRSKQFLSRNKVKTRLVVGNILKPRKEFVGKFDAIYAMGVVGMLEERRLKNLLKLIHGYLRPNGIFLDVDWTDCQLSREKYKERQGYEWYSKEGPSIKRIGSLIKRAKFRIIEHGTYDVPNKKEYAWGKIYGYLAQK